MKGWYFIGIFLLAATGASAQQKTTYVGHIGDTYSVEMELETSNGKDYKGRYRYGGRDEWSRLSGTLYYDKRNAVAKNLVLQEYTGDRNTGVFDLFMENGSLNGTWRKEAQAPEGLPVALTEGKLGLPGPADGFYYAENNELKVTAISDKAIEVDIWIAANRNCKGLRFTGQLIKVGTDWKGSLPDANDNGDAAITLSINGDKANLEINPAFVPGADCRIGTTPYMRQLRKQKGEIR